MRNEPLLASEAPTAQPALTALDHALQDFYGRVGGEGYFTLAEEANRVWPSRSYHSVLLDLVKPGDAILDLGCGSAHALRNISSRCEDISYTGVDWCSEQMSRNREQFGGAARFVTASLYETGDGKMQMQQG